MMHAYRAYGLEIASELALPELIEREERRQGAPDVTVRLGGVFDAPAPPARGEMNWRANADEACFNIPQAGVFLVRQGREIIIDISAGVEERTCRLFLLGPILGMLLHQRGFLVLHASSVVVDGKAVAFMGEPGQGKSTFAATMRQRGHLLLADDIVAVDVQAEPAPICYPGFPQLKLFPEAAAQLNANAAALPPIKPDNEKRACRLNDIEFAARPAPLARLYVLETADREDIASPSAHESFMNLVRHSYALAILRESATQEKHFQQTLKLTRTTPLRCLRRRRELSLLPSVAMMVEDDVARGQP